MTKLEMTHKQMSEQAAKHGIVPDHFGYWRLSDGATLVYAANGGKTYREQLLYLLKRNDRVTK